VTATTPRHRLLRLRLLALRNAVVGYEPHQQSIRVLLDRPVTKLGVEERRINYLSWRYRRQISPELVPYRAPKPPS
jgi:hypothetical protein